MNRATPLEAVEPLSLTIGDGPAVPIVDEDNLAAELARLDSLDEGQSAILQRRTRHYIKATRRGAFWSASLRKGPIWTLNSFSPDGTTEYSARKVRESREAGSLLNRMKAALASPAPVNALNRGQIEELFKAYLLGTTFPVPLGDWAG